MNLFKWVFIFIFFHFPQTIWAQENFEKRLSDLEKKLKQTELQQMEIYTHLIEGRGKVSSFLGTKILSGGFFESGVTSIWGPDTEYQITSNAHLLGFNIAANYTQNIRFVSQFINALVFNLDNPHNNPNVNPSKRKFGSYFIGSLLTQAFVEYTKKPSLKIQTGLGYAPFGKGFQQREPVLFHRRSGPQMLSAGGSDNIGLAFPLWMGVHIHGSFAEEDEHFGYNLYTFTPVPNGRELGEGARIWWSPEPNTLIGLSGQIGKDGPNNFYSHGIDLEWKSEQLGFLLEYARNQVTNSPSPESYYLEPYYLFDGNNWLVYTVFDYLDNANNKTSTSKVDDPYKRWIYGFGFNWLPVSYIRFRLGYLSHNYVGDTSSILSQRRSFESMDLSVGVAF